MRSIRISIDNIGSLLFSNALLSRRLIVIDGARVTIQGYLDERFRINGRCRVGGIESFTLQRNIIVPSPASAG